MLAPTRLCALRGHALGRTGGSALLRPHRPTCRPDLGTGARTREAQEGGGDWIPKRVMPGAKEPAGRSGAGRTGASIRSSFREDSGERPTHRNPAPAWPELLLDTHRVGARALLSARGAWGPLTPSSRSFLSQEVVDFTPPPAGEQLLS